MSRLKFEMAAMRFCEANARLAELRQLWRQVKHDHNGEEVCCRGHFAKSTADWCEVCTAYPLDEYKATLRARQSATRSMMAWYGRLHQSEAA